MPRLLMDILYLPLVILYLPFLAYQMIALKKNRRGWKERLGFIRSRVGNRPCVWIHAVSLGEVNATRSIVAEIERRLPAYDIFISATTDTGYAAARKHYGPDRVFRYPLDFSCVVRRVLDRIRPNAIILMELEVWPNLIAMSHDRGIPLGVANGRVTEEKSMRRFQRPILRGLARRMFSKIAWIGAQDETYAERFVRLGGRPDRMHVTGTVKYDTALIADRVPGADTLASAMGIDETRPLFVAGSTGPGEEELLLSAFTELRKPHADLQLALIPRKPERFDDVARLIESRGFACERRSRRPDPGAGAAPSPPRQSDRPIVFLGDTMGELRKFYALADGVFVGRSLVQMGGSDLMEVAGLGRPMCFGPHVENFADVASKLTGDDAAVMLSGTDALVPCIRRFLEDSETAQAMGRRAQEVVRRNTGATRRTVDLVCESLGLRADHPNASISTPKIQIAQSPDVSGPGR